MKFLKNFKKNEIVIYAIALMLVTAGYFNYTTNMDGASLETYSESINEISDEYANIGDARLVNSNDVVEENEQISEVEKENKEIKDEDNEEERSSENVQEENSAIETNEDSADNSIETNAEYTATNSTDNDYFVSSKLERDTNYASMISTYIKIMEDSSISETQKSIAMKEINEINDMKNSISICEKILSTKGFSNLVIFINKDSVNVVVKVEEGLATNKIAQIQNVVYRELGTEIENIHITEKE